MTDNIFTHRGLVTRYQQSGSGPDLVLIHGIGLHLNCWDSLMPELEANFRVLRYDLRGFGRSSRPQGRCELGMYIEDLANLLHHLSIGRCHILGFSIGGLIAQGFALSYPGTVDRLMLCSTLGGLQAQERAYMQARYQALAISDTGAHFRASLDNYFTPGFVEANPGLIDRLATEAAANDAAIFRAAYRIIAETDMISDLPAITVPTLVMTGEEDRASPEMAMAMGAAIPGARTHIFPGLRHNLMYEAPQQLAGVIQRFLSEVAA